MPGRAMARKSKYKGSSRQRQAKAATRARIAKLKKQGLIRTVSAKPGKRPGGSVYAQLKRFANVLNKNAVAIKAPPKTRKAYKGTFVIKHGKVVVPVEAGARRPRIERKTGLITTTHIRGKRKLKAYKLPRKATIENIPTGPNITYAIQLNNWTSKVRFSRLDDLTKFLAQYDLKNHMDAIEIVVGEDVDDEEAA